MRIHIQPIGRRVPPTPEERCAKSGKRLFPTQEHADLQAAEWAHHNSAQFYSYPCKHCGGYHLTRREV